MKKIVILSYLLAFDAPVGGGGSRRSIGTPFDIEILEWCRYPMVKKFEDIFICFGVTHERDGQTDRRTPGDGIYRAYAYASRGKNRRATDHYTAIQ